MRKIILFLLLTASLSTFAKVYKGEILFKDGHSESGYLKSFLEDKVINLGLSSSLEHELNLDDKTVNFSTTENGTFIKLPIDNIDQVIIFGENKTTTYKVIFLKEISAKGEILDKGRKVFLPLIKKGKINIYGIKFVESGNTPISGPFTSREYKFYYQNAKEDYAINYYNLDNELILFSFKNRIIKPFQALFKDCPELIKELDDALVNFYKMDKETKKQQKEEHKELMKEFHSLPNDQQEDLKTIHHYELNAFDKLISKYELCK